MPIRQIVSRSIKDGEIVDADVNTSITGAKFSGVGFFQGENGDTSSASKKGDIFRVNESTLNTSVTIASSDNALCVVPFDGINFWNCKPYSQRKSDDCIGDREWVQH